jgi:hypothetical protein
MLRMKKLFPVLALCLMACCGCARHWVMTLTNGTQIDTRGKPKLQKGYYVYKDPLGREGYVYAGRVREMGPASMMEQQKEAFNPGPWK